VPSHPWGRKRRLSKKRKIALELFSVKNRKKTEKQKRGKSTQPGKTVRPDTVEKTQAKGKTPPRKGRLTKKKELRNGTKKFVARRPLPYPENKNHPGLTDGRQKGGEPFGYLALPPRHKRTRPRGKFFSRVPGVSRTEGRPTR